MSSGCYRPSDLSGSRGPVVCREELPEITDKRWDWIPGGTRNNARLRPFVNGQPINGSLEPYAASTKLGCVLCRMRDENGQLVRNTFAKPVTQRLFGRVTLEKCDC